VLGAVVLSLENVSVESDIAATEAKFIREHAPSYVSCRVPLDDTATLLALQANGFRFIETQLKAAVEPKREFDVSGYPYGFERVATDADLEAVVRIATAAIRHDRFSIDPEMPRWFSPARYEAYLRKSFEAADEEIWLLRAEASGKLVAFRSFRCVPDGTALLLLDAVSPEVPTVGIGMIVTQFFLSEMFRRRIRSVVTHASVTFLPEFALEFTGFGFRLVKAYAVFRKIYEPAAAFSRARDAASGGNRPNFSQT
jgi:hypothetical protein